MLIGSFGGLGTYNDGGWHLIAFSRRETALLQHSLVLASGLHIENGLQVRHGQGMNYLPAAKPRNTFTQSEILMWIRRRDVDS